MARTGQPHPKGAISIRQASSARHVPEDCARHTGCRLLPSVAVCSPHVALSAQVDLGWSDQPEGNEGMIERQPPRTRLEQLLRQRHLTLEQFRKNYQRATKGTVLSERQAYR